MPCGCLKPKCGSQSAVNFVCENDGRDVEFISLAEFLPRVTLIAKGVPDDVALEYLRQAAQTLARDSLLLKRELRLDDRYFKQGIAQAKIDVMRHFETGEHTLNHWGRI